MMSSEQFEQLLNKLDTLIKISVINAFQGKSRAEVITILSELGFNNKDIAAVVGTTPSYVAKVRSQAKKQRKKKKSSSKDSNVGAKSNE